MNPTINDIVLFINKNKKDKVFKGDTQTDIYQLVQQAVILGRIGVATLDDKIIGIAIASKVDLDDKTVFIRNMLTTKREAMPQIAKWFHKQFQGYSINAKRYGDNVSYGNKTNKLIKRLSIV